MKKVKIINNTRFFGFILLLLTLLVLAVSLTVNANNSIEKVDMELIGQFEQVQVMVRAGETSWDIQQRLTPNHDVREVLYFTGLINDKQMGNIVTGEILTFLKER